MILLAAWIFFRVLTDCHGGPEKVVEYELMATQLRVVVEAAACTDEQGQAVACERTIPGDPLVIRTIPDPRAGAEVVFPEDPVGHPDLLPLCQHPTCVVGWPWLNPVVAVDEAGNRSGGKCP